MNAAATDRLVTTIQAMDRPALTKALLTMRTGVPLDFSQEFLQQWSEEKLRHVLFAAAMQGNAELP